MTQQAPWIWPERNRDDRVIDVTAWCRRLRLHDLYGPFENGPGSSHEGLLADKLEAALGHFPERSGNVDESVFTLMALRVHHAAARFGDAERLLSRAKLGASVRDAVDFHALSWANVLHAEQLLLARGTRALTAAALVKAIDNPQDGPWGDAKGRSMRDWIRALLDQQDAFGSDVDAVLQAHARAVAAQLMLMRGPDREMLLLMGVNDPTSASPRR